MSQLDTAREAKQFRFPFGIALALAALLANLLVFWLVFSSLKGSRQEYQNRAVVVSQNIARLLEQSIADSIERTELVLYSVGDDIARQMTAGRINQQDLDAEIVRNHSRMPDLEGIMVTDAKGIVRDGIKAQIPISVATNDVFLYLRDHPASGTVISKPMFGTISNKWTIMVARRYQYPGGSFGGIVGGIIDLEYFNLLFSSLNVGASGSISLRGEDMGIIFRYPEPDEGTSLIGQKQASPVFQSMLKQQPYKGSFTATSPIDGLKRTLSYQKIGKWPLQVLVGLAENDYLADWDVEVRKSIAAAVLFSLLSGLLVALIYRYVRARRLYLDELQRNQQKFQDLAEMSSDWFWEQDRKFRFARVTNDLSKKYGLSGENFEGKTRWEISSDKGEELWAAHRAVLEAHQPFEDFEYCFINHEGNQRCISVSGGPVFDADGNFEGYHGIGKDITERRNYEERIQHMAQYDSLTNLPNRALFYDRLHQMIGHATRESNEFALLYFDLDKFKPINDQYGHGVGDILLTKAAERVQALLRKSDTVGRLGGDEFAVLLPRVKCREDAEDVSRKIINELAAPFFLRGINKRIVIGVSIGIAIFPQDAAETEDMIKAADAAMYQAKQSGNCYFLYSEIPVAQAQT